LLTEYGRRRLAGCKDAGLSMDELTMRVKRLVNQEYRVLSTGKRIAKVWAEIEQRLQESDEVPTAELEEPLSGLMELFVDLQDDMSARKDNIDHILQGEREKVQAFTRLRDDIGREKVQVPIVAGAAAIVAGAALGPVTLAVGGIWALLVSCGHHSAACKYQQALEEDIGRHQAPIEYMQTLVQNLDDSVECATRHSESLTDGKGAVRSRRALMRAERMMEELEVLTAQACQNYIALAGNEDLDQGFNLAEHKRLHQVRQMLKDHGAEVARAALGET